jgi:DNA-binding NarL/FixJ family response regulator
MPTVAQRISVVGGKPTWQRGMEAMITDLGYGAVSFGDLASWRPGRGGRAVVVFVPFDEQVDALVDFATEHPHIPVVAVVPDLDLASFAQVLRAGAWGAVDDSDSESVLKEAIGSAVADRVSVPLPIMRAMARRIPPPNEVDVIVDDTEAGWLRALAAGDTVAGLAERIGYSERETYRLLGSLYEKLGVTNRTEAIIWATRHGLLDPDLD